jgi:hypothetical protein
MRRKLSRRPIWMWCMWGHPGDYGHPDVTQGDEWDFGDLSSS